jgi:drug/metabolite transporter (DMT)-like permease
VAIEKKISGLMWLALIGINLIYACTYVCMKMASVHDFFSVKYVLWILGTVGIMGVYAVLWQQVLARIQLSTAYMFKGMSLVFVLIFSAFLLGEGITWPNVLGSIIIISGIILYAKS